MIDIKEKRTMSNSHQCKSEYGHEMRCQLRKGHKGTHEFTKYWTDDE